MSAVAMPRIGERMMTSALPWPQKLDGRTYQPVRRNSVPEEEAKSFYLKERAGHTGRQILQAARRLMTDTFAGRKKGARRGALTLADYNILKFMIWECWDKRTGKLDPAYSQIQKGTGHARQTIARALDRLERLGFIDRMRRSRRVQLDDGTIEVRQTNNAYRVHLPERVRRWRWGRRWTWRRPWSLKMTVTSMASAAFGRSAISTGWPTASSSPFATMPYARSVFVAPTRRR